MDQLKKTNMYHNKPKPKRRTIKIPLFILKGTEIKTKSGARSVSTANNVENRTSITQSGTRGSRMYTHTPVLKAKRLSFLLSSSPEKCGMFISPFTTNFA